MTTTVKVAPANNSKSLRTTSSAEQDQIAPEMTETRETAETKVAPNQRLVFPLALTIAAIFPIALGVGVVRLKASARSATDTGTASVIARERVDADEVVLRSRPIDRRMGDQQFHEQRYEVALQYYQSLGTADPARLPPEMAYRIALSQEGLGQWTEALERFRTVTDATENSVLKAAASLGQARVWMRLREPAKAEPLLRSLVLRAEAYGPLPREMFGEVAFLIPLAQTQTAVLARQSDVTRLQPGYAVNDFLPVEGGGPCSGFAEAPVNQESDKIRGFLEAKSAPATHSPVFSPKNRSRRCQTGPVSDQLDWPLDSALQWGTGLSRDEIPEPDATAPDNALVCHVHRLTGQTEHAPTLDEWRADFICNGQTLRSIVDRLADECGWNLDWSDVSPLQSLDRVVNLNAENVPVCLLLNVVCSELKSRWTLEDDRLAILRTEENGDPAHNMIAQTLTSLMDWDPHHRLARHAQFAVAQLAHLDDRPADAARMFASLVGRDSSPLAICAAYNAATNYVRVGDFSRACEQLGYVIDGAPGHALHTEAMIFCGRLLLDCGESQAAVFQLRRAAESRGRGGSQARAAVLLGLSFLAQGKHHEAAEAVFVHKSQFDNTSVRNAAAFVTAFARWRTLKRERQEREATFLYRSLLSIKSDAGWLGLTGQLLIGRAFSELGFVDQMAEVYERMPHEGLPDKIRHEIKSSLAEYALTVGHPEQAKAMWEELSADNEDAWTNRARLQLAELEFSEGNFQSCLGMCRSLHHREGIAREVLQQLMGRAYERLGDDARAARSYAGQMPPP